MDAFFAKVNELLDQLQAFIAKIITFVEGFANIGNSEK